MRIPFLLLLGACTHGESAPKSPAPTAPVEGAAAPPSAPAAVPSDSHGHEGHGDGAHGAEGHGHAALHGGIQKELDGMHVEALLLPTGVMVYLTNADNQALPVEGWTGKALVNGSGSVSTVDLQAMGDHLYAPAKLEHGKPGSVVLTLTKDGKAQSVQFESPSVGLQVHDHTSIHGGQVGMWGNYHVEYLGVDGEHRVWLSDATRVEFKSGVSGSVKEGDKVIPLTQDATGMLAAKSEGAGTAGVSIELTSEGQAISLAFQGSEAMVHDHGGQSAAEHHHGSK